MFAIISLVIGFYLILNSISTYLIFKNIFQNNYNFTHQLDYEIKVLFDKCNFCINIEINRNSTRNLSTFKTYISSYSNLNLIEKIKTFQMENE